MNSFCNHCFSALSFYLCFVLCSEFGEKKSFLLSVLYSYIFGCLESSSNWLLRIIFQHVLEHGNPNERSAIIKKLTGQIVQMSQQKFASNVIEKCLTFGTPAERQNLVNEMLGSTDENEPLQVCHSLRAPIVG